MPVLGKETHDQARNHDPKARTFLCDDCEETKTLIGSMFLVDRPRDASPAYVAALRAGKIRKPKGYFVCKDCIDDRWNVDWAQ